MVVGVTGGIGSGKSTVCQLFADRGRTVLSADEIASHIVNSNSRVRAALRRTFGPQVFTKRGEVDRTWLASVVFRHPAKLRMLNSIVHPAVVATLLHRISSLPASKRTPFVLVESALIFEAQLEAMFDLILLVRVPLSTRISRVHAGTGLSPSEIRRRASTQISPREARLRADLSVANKGTLRQLRQAVAVLDRILAEMPKTASGNLRK